MRRVVLITVLALFCAAPAVSLAQGQQSGALSGRVSSADGLPLPGATVMVTSDALQGQREATTDINGVYAVPGLPPGRYIVRFAMDALSSVERRVDVPLGIALVVNQQLALAPFKEVVDVRGATPPAISSRGGINLRSTQIAVLPIGRTPFLVSELAPGLTDNTPSAAATRSPAPSARVSPTGRGRPNHRRRVRTG